jgi:hypothetical protein
LLLDKQAIIESVRSLQRDAITPRRLHVKYFWKLLLIGHPRRLEVRLFGWLDKWIE